MKVGGHLKTFIGCFAHRLQSQTYALLTRRKKGTDMHNFGQKPSFVSPETWNRPGAFNLGYGMFNTCAVFNLLCFKLLRWRPCLRRIWAVVYSVMSGYWFGYILPASKTHWSGNDKSAAISGNMRYCWASFWWPRNPILMNLMVPWQSTIICEWIAWWCWCPD